MLELNCKLEFDPAREEEFFSALPPKPSVCLLEPHEESAEPYLIRTADLRRRLQRLLGEPDPASKRLNLREFARFVRYRLTGSAFEQSLTHYQRAKEIFPARYRDMLRLHVLPALGAKKSRRLHKGEIKALLVQKLNAGYSRDTVRVIHATLRAMLSEAVEDGLLTVNPAEKIHRRLRLVASATARRVGGPRPTAPGSGPAGRRGRGWRASRSGGRA